MKTKTIALLIPFIAAGLFFAGPAQAQKPIPGIKKTAEWRSLESYVTTLQGKVSTPTTETQKQTYRTNLGNRRLKANAKVKALYQRRLTRITSRDQKKEQRQIAQIRANEKNKVNQLKNDRAARLATARATIDSKVASIKASYAASLDSARSNLRRLKTSLARTKDPFRRQVILQRIDTVQNQIDQLRSQQRQKIDDARSRHRAKVAQIRSAYADRIASSRDYYDSLVVTVKNTWKKLYREDVQQIKQRRTSEYQLVTNLRDRGAGYIDQMPTPVT